jgi:hypothetical protein
MRHKVVHDYADNLDGYRLEHNNPVATPWKTHGIFMAFSADVCRSVRSSVCTPQ